MEEQKTIKNSTIIAVDIDGTLTEETCWTPEQCLNATPRLDVIKKVNELYKTKFIVMYTARRDHLIESTIKWLKKNEIGFHSFSNNKMAADFYIDDKCMDVEDFLKLKD